MTYFHIFPVQHSDCPYLTFDAYVETETEDMFTGAIRVSCISCGMPFQAMVESTKCTPDRPDHLPMAAIA